MCSRQPNLARVVERLGAEWCVVYGVVTEICVLSAVRGLLRMGQAVTVVTDAVETLRAEDGGGRSQRRARAEPAWRRWER